MSKYIKGPWKVQDSFHQSVLDADGAPVFNGPVNAVSLAEGLSRTRLIAAAPELLEACKRLLLWRDADGKATLKGSETMIDVYVREAVRKAEGSTNASELLDACKAAFGFLHRAQKLKDGQDIKLLHAAALASMEVLAKAVRKAEGNDE